MKLSARKNTGRGVDLVSQQIRKIRGYSKGALYNSAE